MSTTENQQQLLAKLAVEKNEKAGELFMQKLDSEKFPMERVSALFRIAAMNAVLKTAPVYHRISLQEFLKVVVLAKDGLHLDSQISYFQFGIMSNSLEAVSPFKLGLTAEEYEILVTELTKNIKFYNDQVAIFREDIQKEADTYIQMKAASMNGLQAVKD